MGIVELDGYFLWKFGPVLVGAPETADKIRQGTGDQEVLLHEAQTLAKAGRVVGIKNSSQRFCGQGFGNGSDKVPMPKPVKVEDIGRACGPKPQRVDGFAAKTNDWSIKRDADQF